LREKFKDTLLATFGGRFLFLVGRERWKIPYHLPFLPFPVSVSSWYATFGKPFPLFNGHPNRFCPATCYSCGGVFHSTGQIMVGPLTVRDARPLPPDLDEFVSNSGGHGFIIVSFGSHVADLPQEEVDMLATAFGKLKQRVVWRLKGNCHGNF